MTPGRTAFVSQAPNPEARVLLFCFPYAGGGGSLYWTWNRTLPTEVQVCPLQLPGRESRMFEPAFDRLSPLGGALAEVLPPLLDRPFAFFGHSMGALIAFELARELRRRDLPAPAHLFASCARAPQLPRAAEPVHHLPEAAFLEGVSRRYGALPAALLQNAEMLQLFLPTLRADFALLETYSYENEPPLDCPITAVAALEDQTVTREDAAAWAMQTSSRFDLWTYPGNHFYLQNATLGLPRAVAEALAVILT